MSGRSGPIFLRGNAAECRVCGGCSLASLERLFAVASTEPPGYSARPQKVRTWFGVDGVVVLSAPSWGVLASLTVWWESSWVAVRRSAHGSREAVGGVRDWRRVYGRFGVPGTQVPKPPGRSARAANRTCILSTWSRVVWRLSCSGELDPIRVPGRRAAGWLG